MAGFEPTASKSQTSRATSCATPRLVEIFDFLGQIRKWSNLRSKVFCRRTRWRKSEKTREKRRFCELSAFGSRGGHTLPNRRQSAQTVVRSAFPGLKKFFVIVIRPLARRPAGRFLFYPPKRGLFRIILSGSRRYGGGVG